MAMKEDTISRQAAIDAIYETFCYAYCDNCDNCEKEMNEDLCDDCHRKYQNWAASKKIISKTINSLPSAERHGRWEQDDQNKWRCSICKAGNNYAYAFDADTKDYTILQDRYCPNCGASMMDDNATQHAECVENALGALDEVTEE